MAATGITSAVRAAAPGQATRRVSSRHGGGVRHPFSAVGAGSGGIVTPANFNNFVDNSFGGTISSLTYTNYSASPGNYQNTFLASGDYADDQRFDRGSQSPLDFGPVSACLGL